MFSAFNTFGRMGAPAGRTLAQQIAAMSPSLWLEPSVTNGYQDSAGTTALTQPGGGSADPPVGKVLDLSGLGNHAIQATSTARPKLSARVNLLTYTEDLTTGAWVKTGCTATTATRLTENSSTGMHLLLQGGGILFTKTATVRAGAGTRRYLSIWSGYAATAYITFDLQTGTISTQGAGVSSASCNASALGGYDCKVSFASAGAIRTAMANSPSFGWSATYTGDGSSYLDIYSQQYELGSAATAYQRVTDANTYAYTGWPLIHQFDGVDDVLNVTFPSSLGSDCTVVTANRGTTPTILTGQTIGTSYTITDTNAGRLVFPRALTAAETAIVTKWATQKGALP